ncbi:response regulator [Weizmannia acidilactici]|uniref:response regulator n=1 Tax=Weizmannia acidilactici TaxID=2607726 RepID=UPI00124E5CD6|nr:response regulator [Weizmannia acidilactici]GER73793.1 chemotaxis protein CheY [Weizmannia acidilactici]
MKKNVLLVDDSMFMRMKLRALLERHGYQVVAEASDGLEAVERYTAYRPDIVLLDITMPHMDGVAALKELMKIDENANVVMCTALGKKSLMLEALQSGAKDFIVKPFFDNLIPVLENLG